MIAVDSSALMAIALNEATADRCTDCLAQSDEIVISAVALAEVLIVANSRGIGDELRLLVEGLGIEAIPATETTAEQVAYVYKTWGKGYHRASLNLVDCFSYAVAKERDCPLLFVGNDFIHTDIVSAI